MGARRVVIAPSPALIALQAGLASCIVVNMGTFGCTAVAIVEGRVLPCSARSCERGAVTLTMDLAAALNAVGLRLDMWLVKKLKESELSVRPRPGELLDEYDHGLLGTLDMDILPQHTRYDIPERAFFQAGLHSLPQLVYRSALAAAEAVGDRRAAPLFREVVLSGGISVLPGMRQRLQWQLRRCDERFADLFVKLNRFDASLDVCTGASLLAAASWLPSIAVDREQWERGDVDVQPLMEAWFWPDKAEEEEEADGMD
eukprot:PLAT14337.1.p2 GENE.PLAT14337.1~~PLAT14337.1.p2  ORF type:complete len:258 (-),score=73.26 PLAT14337.1:106-879(-)